MYGVLSAFLAELALITYRDIGGTEAQKAGHTINGLPLPADYLAACALFGALGLVPKGGGAAKAAGLLAWGFVIATALNLTPAELNPSSTTKSTQQTTTGKQVA